MEILEALDQLPEEAACFVFYKEEVEDLKNGQKQKIYAPVYDPNSPANEGEPIDLKAVMLFNKPFLPSNDDWKSNLENSLWYLNHYFGSAFTLDMFTQSINIECQAVVLPASTLHRIIGLIKKYGLESYEDLVLYLISIAQHYWIHFGIYQYDEAPQLLNPLRKLEKELVQFIELIKRTQIDAYKAEIIKAENQEMQKRAKYLRTSFDRHTKDIQTAITIDLPNKKYQFRSPQLTDFIMNAIFDKLREGDANWQSVMIDQFFRFNWKIYRAQDFKYQLTQCLHQFLSNTTLKPAAGKQTSDEEMRCIIDLLDIAMIPIRDRKGKPEVMEDDKIEVVRQWLKKKVYDREYVISLFSEQ